MHFRFIVGLDFSYLSCLTRLLIEPLCAHVGVPEDNVCVPHSSTLRIKSFDSLNTHNTRSSKLLQPQYRSLVSCRDNDSNTSHE